MSVPSDDGDDPGRYRLGMVVARVHASASPLVTLPDATAVRDYLLGKQAPLDAADRAARELAVPVTVTKRGALLLGRADA